MPENKSQPKHRVSVPAKSALKTSSKPKSAQPQSSLGKHAPQSKGSISIKAGSGFANKGKEVKKRKAEVEVEESDEDEGDEDVDMDAGNEEEGDSEGSLEDDDGEEDDTDDEINGMTSDKRKSKQNTSMCHHPVLRSM